ncbi:hypothetical protein CRH09_15660 [Nocardia terpenica]|uniref:Uncharacterized protein n=1 Tax=Nocardia terpenica TaxID=455432 RepID=A0A291RJE7_9NOCA|nr:hypothetical protein CRH09_15660 [Nocardia terpenica]
MIPARFWPGSRHHPRHPGTLHPPHPGTLHPPHPGTLHPRHPGTLFAGITAPSPAHAPKTVASDRPPDYPQW